jgi:hypothetical protein
VHFRYYTALFLQVFIVEIRPPFLLLKIEKESALAEQLAWVFRSILDLQLALELLFFLLQQKLLHDALI